MEKEVGPKVKPRVAPFSFMGKGTRKTSHLQARLSCFLLFPMGFIK